MSDYGQDVSTFPDLDVTGRTISGARCVAECTLRRLTTEEGTLDYDRDFGRDIRDLLNADVTPKEIRREEIRVANEIEKDERVLRADVTMTLDEQKQTLTIRVGGELVDAESFDFVLAITAVSAEILKAA